MAGKTRQTMNAHRLAFEAFIMGGEQAQARIFNALFTAFIEKERDIGCYDFWSNATLTTEVMTADTAKAFLLMDELRDHVNCLIRRSVLQDIKEIPFKIVLIDGLLKEQKLLRAFTN